jgi:hypothetical protein
LLPIQSWDQYTDDFFGHETLDLGLTEDYQSFSVVPETLRDTQEQIELWTTGNVPLPSPDQTPPVEEAYICYGTVSRLAHIMFNLVYSAYFRKRQPCPLFQLTRQKTLLSR